MDSKTEIDQSQPVQKDQVKMRALHRASLRLFADLSLDGVLRRITEAARDLANAQYAALGVPDGKGGLEAFIAIGLTEVQVKQIGRHPVGKGLLGEIMLSGKSIRIPKVSDHPKASGYPKNHPPMDSFLGVPISAYGRRIGQIYLTEKIDGDEFSEDDQRLIEMLAAHAAAAIENARLYRQVLRSEVELKQRNEELELINSLTAAVNSSMKLEELLGIMLERVIGLFDASTGDIFLCREGETDFRLALHGGPENESLWLVDRIRSGEGFIGRVAKRGSPAWTQDLQAEGEYLNLDSFEDEDGTLVAVPLLSRGQVVGMISLLFHELRIVSEREVGLLEAVGAGVGVAIHNARLSRQGRRVAVLEERERIAMDLHDGIIQSIYATGLTLDSTRVLIETSPDAASRRLQASMESLNAIIRDIRAYILDLQPTRIEGSDLKTSIERLGLEFKANSLIDLETHLEQEAISLLDRKQAVTLFHIAQEALANVGKHAQAKRVWLTIRDSMDSILLQVIDNGRGFDVGKEPGRLGHGLSNMVERALGIGADLEVISSLGDGTTITVRLDKQTDNSKSFTYQDEPGEQTAVD
jgi:two-component system, NarL family, sensor histidine kinase DevS